MSATANMTNSGVAPGTVVSLHFIIYTPIKMKTLLRYEKKKKKKTSENFHSNI